ncbi:MAG: hypothetical protein IJY09_04200 [Lachnospiraceae bacterium]|nr:hypothetical protein [Lachnospiraceae bacterium]
MRNRKKLVAVCMLLALLVTIMPQECVKASEGQETTSIVQPRYSNLQDATLGFGVDENGLATGAVVCLYYGSCTDYVQIRFQLQRYTEAEGWTSIYTTITNVHENPATNTFSRNVTKGYTYRTVATLDFYYNGEIAERVVIPSVTDTY